MTRRQVLGGGLAVGAGLSARGGAVLRSSPAWAAADIAPGPGETR